MLRRACPTDLSDAEFCLSGCVRPAAKARGRRGYNAARTLNGRNRHLLVDTRGLVLKEGRTNPGAVARDGPRCIATVAGSVRVAPELWHLRVGLGAEQRSGAPGLFCPRVGAAQAPAAARRASRPVSEPAATGASGDERGTDQHQEQGRGRPALDPARKHQD